MISLDILNMDVLGEIFSYIPEHVKRNLNKTYYNLSAPPHITNMDSFIRCIIRQDADIIFAPHLKKNYKRWRKIKNWIYKNMKFFNYIEYLRYLCCLYESQKCKEILLRLEKEIKPNAKKKYKKMKIRSIRWNN